MWLATRQRIEGSADVNVDVDVSRGAHSFRPTSKGYITDCRTSCYRAGMPAGMGGECDTPRARHPCTSISGLRWVKGSLRQGFTLPLTQLPAHLQIVMITRPTPVQEKGFRLLNISPVCTQ